MLRMAAERSKPETGSWQVPWAACVSISLLVTPVIQHLSFMAKTRSASADVWRGLELRADGPVISINKGLQKGAHTQPPFCVLSK